MHELISVLIICFVAFGASLVADHRDPVSDLEKKWGFDVRGSSDLEPPLSRSA